jgi:hypothetical protein
MLKKLVIALNARGLNDVTSVTTLNNNKHNNKNNKRGQARRIRIDVLVFYLTIL